jgi:hypothetical protein
MTRENLMNKRAEGKKGRLDNSSFEHRQQSGSMTKMTYVRELLKFNHRQPFTYQCLEVLS